MSFRAGAFDRRKPVVNAVAVAAGAFGAGVNAGRTESSSTSRVINILSGSGLVLAGASEVLGKRSEHFTHLGIGVLSETFADLGFRVGKHFTRK